ncbi:hypothetical protein CPAR01_08919 [Colletotrichum paranaense]|uniref:Uncharacterized protein n=1 Tax=Colletotrichum paranaense TaxID=1914294 RepID=A0ABQ9SFH0_9PEZI|nr:uncharacterized protein CPAR01_08919 [Colletotrichum paranaense]KAK1535377.1 hypothetical protein CPAR01_08919 [Colletotrichum paranaense]
MIQDPESEVGTAPSSQTEARSNSARVNPVSRVPGRTPFFHCVLQSAWDPTTSSRYGGIMSPR